MIPALCTAVVGTGENKHIRQRCKQKGESQADTGIHRADAKPAEVNENPRMDVPNDFRTGSGEGMYKGKDPAQWSVCSDNSSRHWACQNTNLSFTLSCSAVAHAVLTSPPGEAESPHEPPAALEPSPHGLQHPLQILRAGEAFSQMEFITHDKAGVYFLWCNYHFTVRGWKSLRSLADFRCLGFWGQTGNETPWGMFISLAFPSVSVRDFQPVLHQPRSLAATAATSFRTLCTLQRTYGGCDPTGGPMFQVISHLHAIWICQHMQPFFFLFPSNFHLLKRELDCRALQVVDENVKKLKKTLQCCSGDIKIMFVGSDFSAVHKENVFPSLLAPCSANPSV